MCFYSKNLFCYVISLSLYKNRDNNYSLMPKIFLFVRVKELLMRFLKRVLDKRKFRNDGRNARTKPSRWGLD